MFLKAGLSENGGVLEPSVTLTARLCVGQGSTGQFQLSSCISLLREASCISLLREAFLPFPSQPLCILQDMAQGTPPVKSPQSSPSGPTPVQSPVTLHSVKGRSLPVLLVYKPLKRKADGGKGSAQEGGFLIHPPMGPGSVSCVDILKQANGVAQ